MPATFSTSKRLQALPPYLFAEIDRKKKAAIAAGRDVINLGVGDPDRPTPEAIIRSLQQHVENPSFHQYALDQGSDALRHSIAAFFNRRFGVELDPESEILPTIGSKEALAHFPLAVVDPGDVGLVPDPRYPVYQSSVQFAGGAPYLMPLLPELGFRPDLGAIPTEILQRTRVMFLNYPNNPTAGAADLEFFERVVALAREHGFIIAQDAAYSEVYFSTPPPSILQVPSAKDVAVEFHSLSKTFNMTGWRVGFAVGASPLIGALAKVKANTDSGIFTAIQMAAVTALDQAETLTGPIRDLYRERRDILVDGLRGLGWEVPSPDATFYVWVPCPAGLSSTETCAKLLDEADLVTTPGLGFGETGDGFFRIALTVDASRLQEAVTRIGQVNF